MADTVTHGGVSWVVLTRGDRPDELAAAVRSLVADGTGDEVLVVQNGGPPIGDVTGARVIRSDENLGVPGGRDRGVRETSSPIVGFLDDDACLLTSDASRAIAERFAVDPALGALGFRIVDDEGATARRHVPRIGGGSAERAGPVATFLGGACAIRREAYDAAGGYWADLFYAHEELDLAWRMIDRGFEVRYEPSLEVRHPHAPISRHEDGWRLTGRNRVMIARRNLPWTIAVPHVVVWLVVGVVRAPGRTCRVSYLAGWRSGWSQRVPRRPLRWSTIRRLTRLGRPPVV